jgi:hypothetical protein
MVRIVPANLIDIARSDQPRVVGDWARTVEVEDLKAGAATNRQKLARGCHAHCGTDPTETVGMVAEVLVVVRLLVLSTVPVKLRRCGIEA